jgi:hypothetical protein
MHALPDRTDKAVRSAIERWVGLLADQRFEEALAMLAPSEQWTPELLGTVIRNYGSVEPREDGRTFSVTAPAVTTEGGDARFEVTWLDPPLTNRLDYAPDLLGHARYDLPLDGAWSDVTATFDILALPDGVALALADVHVM